MKGRAYQATAEAPVNLPPAPSRLTRMLPRLVALALAMLTMVLVLHSQHQVGIARDETVYMRYGTQYARYWTDLVTGDGSVSDRAITKAFGGPSATDGNREHPPLIKTLMGLSERLLHDKLELVDEVTGYRVPSALLAALLVVLVFSFARRVWGMSEGILAAALTLLMPRAFFHSSLACFDAPIATLWFATIYAYWRALESRRWSWVAGVMFGLALATKHNALLLPAAVGLHYLVVGARSERERITSALAAAATSSRATRWLSAVRATGAAVGAGFVRRRPSVIVAMALLGPLTLYAVWPWLWHHPVTRVGDWLSFHFNHVHYNFEYLGTNYNTPPFPWHVALVTTLFTIPVVTLVGAVMGAAVMAQRAWRGLAADAARAPGLLLALSAAVSVGPFFLGSTPIFGAEKHWQPAMASLAIAAAVGLVWAARAGAAAVISLRSWDGVRAKQATLVALGFVSALAIGASAVETFHAQPYALTNYNALAGGAPGGADLGMNRQFWGYAARGVLPYLRAHAPGPGEPKAPVYSHDASPAWGYYERGAESSATIPRSMPDAGMEGTGVARSTWALVVHEKHFLRHDLMIWENYGTVAPVFVLRVDGVPIVSLYRRPAVGPN